jgi:hypothetical protein
MQSGLSLTHPTAWANRAGEVEKNSTSSLSKLRDRGPTGAPALPLRI